MTRRLPQRSTSLLSKCSAANHRLCPTLCPDAAKPRPTREQSTGRRDKLWAKRKSHVGKGAAVSAAGNRMVGPPSSWSLRDQRVRVGDCPAGHRYTSGLRGCFLASDPQLDSTSRFSHVRNPVSMLAVCLHQRRGISCDQLIRVGRKRWRAEPIPDVKGLREIVAARSAPPSAKWIPSHESCRCQAGRRSWRPAARPMAARRRDLIASRSARLRYIKRGAASTEGLSTTGWKPSGRSMLSGELRAWEGLSL